MGRHHFPEPRPTAPAPTRPRRAVDDPAPAARPRRRIGGKVVTLAIGSALAVGFIPGAAPAVSVTETPSVLEAGSRSTWAQQNPRKAAELVGRANRAARGAAAKPTASTTTTPTPSTTATTPSSSTGTSSASTSTSSTSTSTSTRATTTTTSSTATTATSGGVLAASTGAVAGVMTTASELSA